MNVKEEWKSKGFIDEPVDESLDLKQEIRRLCREKDAIGTGARSCQDGGQGDGYVWRPLHGRDLQAAFAGEDGALARPYGGLLAGRQLQG